MYHPTPTPRRRRARRPPCWSRCRVVVGGHGAARLVWASYHFVSPSIARSCAIEAKVIACLDGVALSLEWREAPCGFTGPLCCWLYWTRGTGKPNWCLKVQNQTEPTWSMKFSIHQKQNSNDHTSISLPLRKSRASFFRSTSLLPSNFICSRMWTEVAIDRVSMYHDFLLGLQ